MTNDIKDKTYCKFKGCLNKTLNLVTEHRWKKWYYMGGSRISDWGGPRIDEARDARKNVAIFTLKSWPIGEGGMALWPPLELPLS